MSEAIHCVYEQFREATCKRTEWYALAWQTEQFDEIGAGRAATR